MPRPVVPLRVLGFERLMASPVPAVAKIRTLALTGSTSMRSQSLMAFILFSAQRPTVTAQQNRRFAWWKRSQSSLVGNPK